MSEVQIDKDVSFSKATSEERASLGLSKTCFTIYSYSIYYKGKLACVAGVEKRNDYFVLFMSKLNVKEVSPFLIVKSARRFLKYMKKEFLVDLYAISDCGICNSNKFLKLLGFKLYTENIYRL